MYIVAPPLSAQSHFSVVVLVVMGTSSIQFVGSVRHCSINVIVVPPGHTGQGTADVTVTVVVGQIGQGVVQVGYGHGPDDVDTGADVGPFVGLALG